MEAFVGLDRISILPQNITERILCLLPIRDALKTSILSRKWRYCWAGIPVLTFDEKMFEGSSSCKQNMSHKPDAIYQVLLQHRSPLLEFTLSIELEMVSKVDQIVVHVSSRCNTSLKNVSILNRSTNNHYKLPCSLFSLRGLERLELVNCDFETPPKFTGFHSLRWLSFFNTETSAKMLKHFLTLCPLVDELFLIGIQKDFTREDTFTFVELFELLPSIKVLAISKDYMEYFASGNMPEKLPISLVHLKILFLGVSFLDHYDVSYTLCLIKSSPNLKKLMFKLHPPPTSMDIAMIYIYEFSLQDHTGFNLDNLEELGMISFSNLSIEMEFMKLVMANSSALKKVVVELDDSLSVDQELEMYRDLIRRPLPRASPSAELIIKRPITSS